MHMRSILPSALTAPVWLLAAWLTGCANVPPTTATSDTVGTSPWGTSSSTPAAPTASWEHYALPGKRPTEFRYVRLDGRDALAVNANASASMVRQKMRLDPDALGQLQFSWNVPALIAGADLADRDLDDTPVRVILAFDGDRSKLSGRNAMLSELARAITGEEMPYATLMYVWCNKRPVNTVLQSARTDRIRKIVVESGSAHLGAWQDYTRDIRADFERVFGEAPGALIGVAVMTDTDNTRSKARAWYGPIRLSAQATAKAPTANH